MLVFGVYVYSTKSLKKTMSFGRGLREVETLTDT